MSEEIVKKRGRLRLVEVAERPQIDPENNLGNPEAVGEIGDHLEGQEGFDEFFEGGAEDVRIQLLRLEPRLWNTKAIYGYLCELHPGDTLQTIADNFGGGVYVVRQVIRGRFRRQKQVRIAGDPRVVHPPPSDASAPYFASSEKPSAASGQIPTVNIQGVHVPVDDFESIKRVVLFTKAVDAAFPKPPDINETLLGLLLNRGDRPVNVLEQAEQFATLAEKLKSLTGDSGGGGTTWLDIGSQALDKID
jgi:hypothetical protein